MSQDEPELTIRRILVALDASTHSLAALQAAAELASQMHAELIGLYVEDVNLIHLAGLPFAIEMVPTSAARRPMTSAEMEQQLRRQAGQARRALEAAAERVRAEHSFRIVRGQVTAAILEAALEADLLALGRVGRPLSRRSRLGSTARAASGAAGRSVLLMKQGAGLKSPVLAIYDGSPTARLALSAAAQLARSHESSLRLVLLAPEQEAAEALRAAIAARLQEQGVRTEYHWLGQPSAAALVRLVPAGGDCILVLGGDNPLMQPAAIQEVLDLTDCPVMLVR
jgi:nucleotide-binding universal stress UspA family protein